MYRLRMFTPATILTLVFVVLVLILTALVLNPNTQLILIN